MIRINLESLIITKFMNKDKFKYKFTNLMLRCIYLIMNIYLLYYITLLNDED